MKPEIMERLLKFFKDDRAKMNKWLHTNNPLLGGVTPMDMVKNGKTKKLEKWIDNLLDENKN